MAGQISFDAAHVICRAAGQIEDEAAALAAEELLLAAARNQRPDLTHRAAAGQEPGPDNAPGADAAAGGDAATGGQGTPDEQMPPDEPPSGEPASPDEQALLGAVGSLRRWGIPGWTRTRCAAWARN